MVKCVVLMHFFFILCLQQQVWRERKNTSPNISESTKGVFHHQMGAFLLKLLRFSLSRVGNFSTSSFHGPLHPERRMKKKGTEKSQLRNCNEYPKKTLQRSNLHFLPSNCHQSNSIDAKVKYTYQNESLQNLNARISNYIHKMFFFNSMKKYPSYRTINIRTFRGQIHKFFNCERLTFFQS